MIIYRMVIVEGRCTKLQLLISYIYNHWLTQKYSEYWLVRYNGMVWSNIAVPFFYHPICMILELNSLFSVTPRQELHSFFDILLSLSWSQYLRKLRPHLLGLSTFLMLSLNTLISPLLNTPSLDSSIWANFHSATSFLALPRIVPFGPPRAPNMLLCSELIISIRLLLKADLSAWVQMSGFFLLLLVFTLLLALFLFLLLCFPLLQRPVTLRRWQRGLLWRTEDPCTGLPWASTHQQYPVPDVD